MLVWAPWDRLSAGRIVRKFAKDKIFTSLVTIVHGYKMIEFCNIWPGFWTTVSHILAAIVSMLVTVAVQCRLQSSRSTYVRSITIPSHGLKRIINMASLGVGYPMSPSPTSRQENLLLFCYLENICNNHQTSFVLI